jgi:hypothetical protein
VEAGEVVAANDVDGDRVDVSQLLALPVTLCVDDIVIDDEVEPLNVLVEETLTDSEVNEDALLEAEIVCETALLGVTDSVEEETSEGEKESSDDAVTVRESELLGERLDNGLDELETEAVERDDTL